MKSLSVALVAALLVAAGPAEKTAGWKEFASKEGRFKALMPGTPKSAAVETENEFGPGVFHMNTVAALGSIYGAHYYDYPETVKKVTLKQLYDTSRDGAVERMKGSVLGESDVKIGDHPGREFRVEVEVERGRPKRVFRARVFLIGTRLYQVSVFGAKEAATSKDADRFLDSFKLID